MRAAEQDEATDVVLRRLSQHKGVKSYVVLSSCGVPIRTLGMDQEKALQYAALVSDLTEISKKFVQGKVFESIVPDVQENKPQVIRLRTNKNEIVISPESEYILVAVQENSEDIIQQPEKIVVAEKPAAPHT